MSQSRLRPRTIPDPWISGIAGPPPIGIKTFPKCDVLPDCGFSASSTIRICRSMTDGAPRAPSGRSLDSESSEDGATANPGPENSHDRSRWLDWPPNSAFDQARSGTRRAGRNRRLLVQFRGPFIRISRSFGEYFLQSRSQRGRPTTTVSGRPQLRPPTESGRRDPWRASWRRCGDFT